MGDFSGSIAVALFLLFIGCCLFLSMWASPDLRVGDGFFREGSEQLGPRPSGLAFAGDIVHATAVFYLIGIVAVGGTDGVIIVACAAVSPLLMQRWLAGKLAAAGGRSFGETVARHLPPGPARRAAGLATLAATIPLLVAQLQPIAETAFLMGVTERSTRQLIILLIGALVLACAAIGAARGATILQIGKIVALLVVAPLLAGLVLFRFDGDLGALVQAAEQQQGATGVYLGMGGLFGESVAGYVDLASFAVSVLLGAAFLPFLVTRLAGAPTPAAARQTAGVGFAVVAFLCCLAAIIGFGTAALVEPRDLAEQGPFGGNNAALLAAVLDGGAAGNLGKWLLFVMCAAFLTVLAAASVLLLSGSAAIVHDLGWGGSSDVEPDVRRDTGAVRPRLAMVGLGTVCILLAVMTPDVSPQFWLIIAYSVTVSTLLPLLVHGLGRRPIPAAALQRCVYGSLALIAVLTFFSPAMSGAPDSVFPDADWSLWPLYAPGAVSMPAGFLLARTWRGTGRTDTPQPMAAPTLP
ncbi:MAG TPA: hypothetical protein DEQ61_14575 [Streptomyces sp.]|nr:hypothetical protein [Streptomyces sp.]